MVTVLRLLNDAITSSGVLGIMLVQKAYDLFKFEAN